MSIIKGVFGLRGILIGSLIGAMALGMVGKASCQTLEEYVHQRNLAHIRYGSSVLALDSLVGARTLEISATVTGDFEANGHSVLLVQDVNGKSINVVTDNPPDWLIGNAVKARLLVKAYRKVVTDPLYVKLIGAAPESDIEDIEYQEKERDRLASQAATHPTRSSRSWQAELTSRHGSARQWYLPSYKVAPYYARYIVKDNPRVSYDKAIEIANQILGYGQMYGVDPRLVMAMVTVESDFDSKSLSSAGAMGLGQLMPSNARDLGISNPYDTGQNLYGSVKLLRENLEKYKRQTGKDFDALVLCMAAYNAGNGAVAKYHGIPPYKETQNYVRRVIKLYYQFCGQ